MVKRETPSVRQLGSSYRTRLLSDPRAVHRELVLARVRCKRERGNGSNVRSLKLHTRGAPIIAIWKTGFSRLRWPASLSVRQPRSRRASAARLASVLSPTELRETGKRESKRGAECLVWVAAAALVWTGWNQGGAYDLVDKIPEQIAVEDSCPAKLTC